MDKDYYSILQITNDASSTEIRTAYKRLALRFHPDKNRSVLAEENFKKIKEAYEVLADARKRVEYDQNRKSFCQNKFRNCGDELFKKFKKNFKDYFTPSDFKDFCFSSSSSSSHQRPPSPASHFKCLFGDVVTSSCFTSSYSGFKRTKDPDLIKEVPLTLEDVLYGKEKMVVVNVKSFNSGVSVGKDKVFKIDVKKGWQAGTKVTFLKEGDSLHKCHIPGDLIFVTADQPHPIFTRDGDHIRYKAKISLLEALCGTTIIIPTLDHPCTGCQLTINDVISPSTTKVIRGQGLPMQSHPEQRGNLLVDFDIRFPDTINPGVKELLVGLI